MKNIPKKYLYLIENIAVILYNYINYTQIDIKLIIGGRNERFTLYL